MPVQFASDLLDTHIAPGVSSFTKAEIPDMSGYAKNSSHWISAFFLNSALRTRFLPPMNAYAYNFIRRAQYAFKEHHSARSATISFIAGGGQSPTLYADALFHWECFLGQSWHSYKLLVTAWEGTAFSPNDGTVEQRLNALYNQMKHVESRIENNQMIPGATVPVWMDNDGLRSIDTSLTYIETGEVLKDLARTADALSDPRTAKDKLNENDA